MSGGHLQLDLPQFSGGCGPVVSRSGASHSLEQFTFWGLPSVCVARRFASGGSVSCCRPAALSSAVSVECGPSACCCRQAPLLEAVVGKALVDEHLGPSALSRPSSMLSVLPCGGQDGERVEFRPVGFGVQAPALRAAVVSTPLLEWWSGAENSGALPALGLLLGGALVFSDLQRGRAGADGPHRRKGHLHEDRLSV